MLLPRTSTGVFLALLLAASPAALGQVYSWVDENGKKHFGDRIPPEYENQGKQVELNATNSADAVAPRERESQSSASSYAERQLEAQRRQAENAERRRKFSSELAEDQFRDVQVSMPTKADLELTPSECAKAKRNYEISQQCMDTCRHVTRNADDRLQARKTHPSCTKCSKVRRPRCA